MNEFSDKHLAVLIDADNISYKSIRNMLVEVTRYGTPTIKRIYGDWTRPEMVGWKGSLLENAITPIQQYGYTSGKNSTDSAMIIDAMDILYTGAVDGFCIVSSDSDFTRLAVRLREAGKIVYGFGEKKTPVPFISACSKFIYIEILEQNVTSESSSRILSPDNHDLSANKQTEQGNGRKSSFKNLSEELKLMLISTVTDLADDDGWANLAAAGALIIKKQPDFDPRNFGFQKLAPLMRSLAIFEFDERSVGNSKVKHIYLKAKEVDIPVQKKQRGSGRK